MNKWTTETEQALEDYLAEVKRLALNEGEDGAEIVTDLREHIVTEAEALAGEVVTLEILQKVLHAVGSPEVVIGIENSRDFARKPEPVMPKALANSGVARAIDAPGRHQKFMIMGKGCAFWAIGLLLLFPLCLVGITILGVVVAIILSSLSRARQSANWQAEERQATIVFEAIAGDQTRFRDNKLSDQDGDGIADYGTLEQLRAMENSAVGAVLWDVNTTQGLAYTLEITPSGVDGAPHFTCEAAPEEAASPFLTWTVSETGEIQSHRH